MCSVWLQPRGAPEIYNAFSEPYSMITFALSLLLVFKVRQTCASVVVADV
jgi:hypothetical protein